ncbi:MAG: UDP-N-acetylmuramate--L-alanine ligase [Candidatus Westeberhardia cardiocondylae]|nr:UDP-N-acetylmuramate--L-alanine ligase [Candidatus Westeberhardia cardiocondylae]
MKIKHKHFSHTKNFIPKMHKIKKIHFIGIGGISMGGIAKILFYEGYKISGSDVITNKITKKLQKLGITIYKKHSKNNIKNPNIIVISNAIPKNNPEIVFAKTMKIPIIKRAEILSEIMRYRYGIAISGTHGKTTTTTMIINIYTKTGMDPTFINGGIHNNLNIHSKLGKSQYIIVEADESDASFLYLRPIITVITNIEPEHMNTYCGKLQKLQETFIKFLKNIPFYGKAIVCIDDPSIKKIINNINNCKIITYGFNPKSDFYINQYKQNKNTSTFNIYRNKKKIHIKLNIPGYHNALNATAAIAVALENNINKKKIVQSMLSFKNANRRFNNLGYYYLQKNNNKNIKIMLIDDYGHHPTEINVNINTIRTGWVKKRLVMIFQPHRYTRTKDLYESFVNVLSKVDKLIILNIYSAGEKPIPGINTTALCKSIKKNKKIQPTFIKNINKIPIILKSILKNNDILLLQGAGTIEKITKKLINKILYK